MGNKSIKIEEIRNIIREMVEATLAPAKPAVKPDKETEVAPAKEKEAQPVRRRGLPNPEKAPEPTPKGQKQATASEMAAANKIADKFNKMSK